MKKLYHLWQRSTLVWCLAAWQLLALSAHKSFAYSTSTTASAAGSSAYTIDGPPTGEAGHGLTYTFTCVLPDGDDATYWHVEGARTIEGKPTAFFQEGDLIARNHQSLTIAWDSISTPDATGLLQLRRLPDGDGPADVLASFSFTIICPPCLPDFGYCRPGIFFLERSGTLVAGLSGVEIQEYTYVCSDANSPANPIHRYAARKSCEGPLAYQNSSGTTGSFPLTMIWYVQYITESGAVYEERWGSSRAPALGTNNTDEIKVTWYDHVPFYSYTNSFPTGLVALEPQAPNALAGQRIVAGRLRYDGLNCGLSGVCPGLQGKTIDVYYETPPPASVFAWTGTPDNSPIITEQHQLPCRTGTYVLECADVRDASQYDWTTSVGTISGSGRRVTLDLSQAPNNTTDFTVSVRATNPSAPCGSPQSSAHVSTFYIPATIGATAISIDGVALTCAGANTRTLSVPPVAGATGYVWQITSTGSNAILSDINGLSPYTNPTPPTNNSVRITFSGPGQVDVTAVTYSACGSPSLGAFASYAPTSSAAPNPLQATNPFNDSNLWKYQTAVRLWLQNPEPGVAYTFGPVSNVRTFTTWPGANPSTPTQPASTSFVTVVPGPNGAAYIDLTLNDPSVAEFDLQVQSTGACGGTGSLTQTIHEVRPFHGGWRQAQPGQNDDPQPTDDGPSDAERAMVLYPNPTTDIVNIAPAEAGHRYEWVRVLDRYGMPLREARTVGDENLQQISLAGLPAGLYAVQLFDGEHVVTRHLVKE